ncbi:hypothetical protein LLH03_03385 [bacterium]|nr:hypothetical protein [bacterium]
MATAFSSDTQRFWQQRGVKAVSPEDAREAIRNVAAFVDLLALWDKGVADESERQAE